MFEQLRGHQYEYIHASSTVHKNHVIHTVIL